MKFLTHETSAERTKSLPEWMSAIVNYPKPEIIIQLPRFLIIINYYRRHLKNTAASQASLNDLLRDSKRNDKRSIPWTETSRVFEKCRKELTQATLLTHPAEQAVLHRHRRVKYNWNSTGAGWARTTKTCCIFLKEVESNSIKVQHIRLRITRRLRNYKILPGQHTRQDLVETDHKPLTYALRQNKASPHQARQLDWIAQFVSGNKHLPGHQNVIADALSRIEAIEALVIVSTRRVNGRTTDEELRTLRQQGSLNLRTINLSDATLPLFCDISEGTIYYVPKTLRRWVFNAVHRLAHPSGRTTSKQIRQKFIWPGINKGIVHWARTYLSYQCAKIQCHTQHLLKKISTPKRFRQVYLNRIGSLSEVKGYRYCLIAIDRYSMVGSHSQDIAANTIAKAFYTNWVARYGTPAIITMDQGQQFESFSEPWKREHFHTTSQWTGW